MSITPTIKFSTLWQPGQGIGEPCRACKDPVYGKKYTLIIVVMGKIEETTFKPTEAILCEPCYILKD